MSKARTSKLRVRNGSGRPNQSGTVQKKPEPRTIFWSSPGWHMDHGPNHGEPDQKSGSNHGSGPDCGSTTFYMSMPLYFREVEVEEMGWTKSMLSRDIRNLKYSDIQ